MLTSMRSVQRFFGANSSRYSAAATPMGKENARVTTSAKKEPTTAPRIPASSGSRESPAVKKVALKRFSIRPCSRRRSTHPIWSSVEPALVLGQVAVDVPLHQHVDVVVGRHPDLDGGPDEVGVLDDHLPDPVGGAGADHAGELAAVAAFLHFRGKGRAPTASPPPGSWRRSTRRRRAGRRCRAPRGPAPPRAARRSGRTRCSRGRRCSGRAWRERASASPIATMP